MLGRGTHPESSLSSQPNYLVSGTRIRELSQVKTKVASTRGRRLRLYSGFHNGRNTWAHMHRRAHTHTEQYTEQLAKAIPNCYRSTVKWPLQAHMLEHLVPTLRYCSRRLWGPDDRHWQTVKAVPMREVTVTSSHRHPLSLSATPSLPQNSDPNKPPALEMLLSPCVSQRRRSKPTWLCS